MSLYIFDFFPKDRILHMAIKTVSKSKMDPTVLIKAVLDSDPGRNQRQAVEEAQGIVSAGNGYCR